MSKSERDDDDDDDDESRFVHILAPRKYKNIINKYLQAHFVNPMR